MTTELKYAKSAVEPSRIVPLGVIKLNPKILDGDTVSHPFPLPNLYLEVFV